MVKASELLVDEDNIYTTLPSINSINPTKSYSTKSKIEDAYAVYCIQCVLYSQGFLKSISDCDGEYGSKTTRAVINFQQKYNSTLPEWTDEIAEDGIWGPQTYDAMLGEYY